MTSSRESRFRELSAEVSAPLRGYVVRRTAPADVDDVLSEVSIVLWRRLEDVPQDTPLPWCYAVARRVIANQHRSDRRRLRLVDRVRTLDLPYVNADPEPDHDDVHQALATLKELDREVVLLWAWEQLAPREIAEVTGLTPNAVSIRLTKARKRLAEVLDRTGQDGKSGQASGHNQFDRGNER